jgi:16S rRNA (cytosine967-C5)-methyltransferase
VQKLQKDILANYSQMIKPGGLVVYATCSILRSENEDQVAQFLGQNSNFKLVKEERILPGTESDGFYMAQLQRLN